MGAEFNTCYLAKARPSPSCLFRPRNPYHPCLHILIAALFLYYSYIVAAVWLLYGYLAVPSLERGFGAYFLYLAIVTHKYAPIPRNYLLCESTPAVPLRYTLKNSPSPAPHLMLHLYIFQPPPYSAPSPLQSTPATCVFRSHPTLALFTGTVP